MTLLVFPSRRFMIRAFPPRVLKFYTGFPPICCNSPFELFNFSLAFTQKMRSYLVSKPPSIVEPVWLNWMAKDYKSLDPELNQIAALVYITQKKNVCTIYKPMPVKNDDGTLSGIIGNMLNEKTTPHSSKLRGKTLAPAVSFIIWMTFLPLTAQKSL